MRVAAKVEMNLVLAEKFDFTGGEENLRLGTMYFLRSGHTGAFTTQPYYMTEFTDKKEFNTFFNAKMVYVPRHIFDPVTVVPLSEAEQQIEHNQ